MEWYLAALQKYAVFSGRARRQEYWMFFLFNVIVSIALTMVDLVLGLGFLSLVYSLAVLIPGLAVSVRRLHDLGKSGWFLLAGFIPVVGVILLIVWMATDSQPGANQYGPNPKLTEVAV